MNKLISRRNAICAILVASGVTLTYLVTQTSFFVAQTVPCHTVIEISGNSYALCQEVDPPCSDCRLGNLRWYDGCPCQKGIFCPNPK